jgi:hypothetical protein
MRNIGASASSAGHLPEVPLMSSRALSAAPHRFEFIPHQMIAPAAMAQRNRNSAMSHWVCCTCEERSAEVISLSLLIELA